MPFPWGRKGEAGAKGPGRRRVVARGLLMTALAGAIIFWWVQMVRSSLNPAEGWARQYRRGDATLRWEAVDNLARLHPDEASHALPTLILALRDDDEEVALIAAESVARAAQAALAAGNSGAAEQGVAALVETIKADRRPLVRAMAANDLGFYSQVANLPGLGTSVTNVLGAALGDPDERVRAKAARAIGSTGRGEQMVSALMGALEGDPSVAVRAEAARSLADVHEESERVTFGLLRAIEPGEPEVRQAATLALRQRRGPWRKVTAALVPGLVELLEKSGDREVVCNAAELLGAIGPEAGPGVPALLRLLGEPVEYLQDAGSQPASELAQAGGAIPSSVEAQAHYKRTWHPPGQAALALGKIAPDTPQESEVTEALLAVLRDDREEPKRMMTAEALCEFGPAVGERVFPVVAKALESDPGAETPFGYQLYQLIERTTTPGPLEGQAVALLIPRLDSADRPTRYRSAVILGQFGAAAAPALGKLKALAESDPAEVVRRNAQEAVGKIEAAMDGGPQARGAGGVRASARPGRLGVPSGPGRERTGR